MKTIEAFLLSELEKANEKIQEVMDKHDEVLISGKVLLSFLDVLYKYLYIVKKKDGKMYIDMDSIDEEENAEDFEIIASMMVAMEEEANDD